MHILWLFCSAVILSTNMYLSNLLALFFPFRFSANSPRPLSARSKFLLGCVKRDVLPQPGVIIRKEVSTILNIASMGIGEF